MIGGLKQTTSRFAIAAAAGLFTGGIALTPVQAASLGGDCCADLEERVAELEATTVRKGNRKVSVKLSGQVNRSILYWDDDEDSDVYFTDTENSSTRFRITGSASISPGRTAGFRIEADWFIHDNTSVVSNCGTTTVTANCMARPNHVGNSFSATTDMRWQEVWIKDDDLGKLSLGKGDMASNDMSHVDLSGTSVAMYAGMSDIGGSFIFRTSGGTFSGITLGSVYDDMDGASRRTRLRYDSPSIGGFVFSGSVSADDRTDGAVRYKKEWNSVRCAGVFAFDHNTTGKDVDNSPVEDAGEGKSGIWTYGGSASCIHSPSGLNLTLGYTWREDDRRNDVDEDDMEWFFVKVGISRRWNSHGKTSIAIQYAQTENERSSGTTSGELDSYGVAFVQNIDSAALELYLAWTHHEYDDNIVGTSYQDLDFFLAGARMKF